MASPAEHRPYSGERADIALGRIQHLASWSDWLYATAAGEANGSGTPIGRQHIANAASGLINQYAHEIDQREGGDATATGEIDRFVTPAQVSAQLDWLLDEMAKPAMIWDLDPRSQHLLRSRHGCLV